MAFVIGPASGIEIKGTGRHGQYPIVQVHASLLERTVCFLVDEGECKLNIATVLVQGGLVQMEVGHVGPSLHTRNI